MRALLLPAITKFLSGLRFRNLFLIAAAIFLLDLFTPDLLVGMPIDEIFLAVTTLVLSQWKNRKAPRTAAEGTPTEAPTAPHDVIDLPRDQVRREG